MELSILAASAEADAGAAKNVHRRLGILKVSLQTHGVEICDALVPRNADAAGVPLLLRDDLERLEVPVYAHRTRQGYRIDRPRTVVQVFGKPLVVEFERPYRAIESNIAGVPFRNICNIEHDGHLSLTANHGCIYVNHGSACRFCAIGDWRDAGDRSVERLADASLHAMSLGEVKHLSITTGTATGPDRGIKSILNVLKRLSRRNLLEGLPAFAEFEPPEDPGWLDCLHSAGVTTIACNLEFLSPSTRRSYAPGKSCIPFQRYLQVWKRGVATFGRGQVFSNILMTCNDETMNGRAKLEELDAMFEVGVIPSPGPLYPDPGSEMHDRPLPALREQVAFLETVADRLHASRLDPRYARAGCHRNGSYSAVNEFYSARAADQSRHSGRVGPKD